MEFDSKRSSMQLDVNLSKSSDCIILFSFQVMNGGIFVLGLMLKLLEILTGKLLNLNLLLVHTGEGMKRNQCCRGFMALHGKMKNN